MKSVLTILLTALTFSLYSQAFFTAAVKGAYGPTLMFNKNIFDDGDYEHVLTSGYGFGGAVGVHFADHHGFTFDYLSATSKQKFDLRDRTMDNYTWKTHDLILMYRYSGNGAYVEFGPKHSIVSNVDSEYRGNAEVDVSQYFEDSYTSLVLGFGSYLMGNELLSLQAGVRLHWALTDMVNDDGQAQSPPYPMQEGVLDAGLEYTPTKATAAQFMLELNYAFGRFARASCSQRWRLILFD